MKKTLSIHTANTAGYTILELMVSIVIFTLGFLGAYLLVQSANDVSIRSKNEIIGANIMREQIELLKNLRDTNWIAYRKWNSIVGAKDTTETETLLGNGFYSIENNFETAKPISLKKLNLASTDKGTIVGAINSGSPTIALCLDRENRYTHNCGSDTKKTAFASFFRVSPLITKDAANAEMRVQDAYKITAFFISTDSGYREYSMDTIITDWKK